MCYLDGANIQRNKELEGFREGYFFCEIHLVFYALYPVGNTIDQKNNRERNEYSFFSRLILFIFSPKNVVERRFFP
ncbi:hypothetical protein BAS09_02595 [Elizabethkingia ursingii]|nr:hypothetical protein BAS09_02595 [Elizabethkingia ursingii]